MKYDLQQGTQSNYVITLTVSPEDLAWFKQKALKSFQKEMKEPGFRPGHVPLDMVEKKVQPQYLEIAQFEEAIHAWTKQLLDENQEIKFIGQVYDLNKEDKENETQFTFKLDVYPEVEVKNKKWEKLTMDELENTASDEEITQTMDNLRKQYADYQPADEVTLDTVFKVSFKHFDEAGEQIDKGSAFLWKEEFDEFTAMQSLFVGQKQGETFTVDYDAEGFWPMLANRNSEKTAAKTEFTVWDVRTVTLPDFTPENIKKFFGNDDVKSKEELEVKVRELIENQKEESLLMQAVDSVLEKSSDSLGIQIPKTLIDEEVKTRMESLKKRLGGEDQMKQYFEQMGEEKANEMKASIKTAAWSSLEKFFLLRKLTELLEIADINWEESMNVEKKLYAKLKK